MKQDVVEYLVDSFVDFKGNSHKIVACALSQSPEVCEDGCELMTGWVNQDGYVCVDEDYHNVYRMVSIGISVCHPEDPFDLEKGKTRAYNKAKYDPKCPCIYTKDKGVIGKALVKAFLKQEVDFLKENPERIISGYNQEKARFDKQQALKNRIENLSDDEKFVIKLANKVNLIQCAELIKEAEAAGIEINE